MSDLRQSKAYRDFQHQEGWCHQKIGSGWLAYRRLPLWPWPVAKLQRAPLPNLKSLLDLGRQLHLFSLTIEPLALTAAQEKTLHEHGFRPLTAAFLPTRTVTLSLRPDLADLRTGCKKDTRSCLKRADAQPLTLCHGTGLELANLFHRAWKKTVGWKLITPSRRTLEHLRRSFKQNLVFLVALSDQEVIAGALILTVGQTAYYYYAFTNPEGRRRLAQYRLVWRAIGWAKKHGCRQFDFEGIAAPGANQKSWRGFSHFKKSFGGQEVVFPTAWEKKFWPVFRPRAPVIPTLRK